MVEKCLFLRLNFLSKDFFICLTDFCLYFVSQTCALRPPSSLQGRLHFKWSFCYPKQIRLVRKTYMCELGEGEVRRAGRWKGEGMAIP